MLPPAFRRAERTIAAVRRRVKNSAGRLPKYAAIADPNDIAAARALVDKEWYLFRYPDLSAQKVDPIDHYLRHGRHEMRQPCSLFDPSWYVSNYGCKEKEKALTHYYLQGYASHNDPHPLFCSHFYEKAVSLPSGDNPLVHYLSTKGEMRTSPCIIFDFRFFKSYHIVNDSRNFSPLETYLASTDQNMRPNALFDPVFYKASLAKNGVSLEGDPLVDYVRRGAFRFDLTIPNFSLRSYFTAIGGRKYHKLNPFIEYVVHEDYSRFSKTLIKDVQHLLFEPPKSWSQTIW